MDSRKKIVIYTVFFKMFCHWSHENMSCMCESLSVFNRPGVAGAVLQTPTSVWSFILFLPIFKTSLLQNRMSSGPEILRQKSPPSMCHMSHIPRHMSCVSCHVSYVMCHFFHFFYKLEKLVGGGSVINGPTPCSFYSI